MQSNLILNNICKKCGGYKFAPYSSNVSATVKLCHCTEISNIDFDEITRRIVKGAKKRKNEM